VDLTSRLRSIVRPFDKAQGTSGGQPLRELTYEPDTGRYQASIDIDRKVLADLAVHDKTAFNKIAEQAKASLA